MNYTIIIAAVFILATIAVAVLSPFDRLPQRSSRETAAAAQAPSDDGGSYADSSSNQDGPPPDDKTDWPAGEAAPK